MFYQEVLNMQRDDVTRHKYEKVALEKACSRVITFKYTQGHHHCYSLIGSISFPVNNLLLRDYDHVHLMDFMYLSFRRLILHVINQCAKFEV